MRKSVENRIAAMRLKKRSMSIRHKLVLVLICAVVAVTTYTLVLPAITMEGDFICGKEVHVHAEDCYALQPDGTKTLICGKEEHIHDETCLVHSDSAEEVYVCGHDYEHVHRDECYRNGELICTLQDHIHTQDCLPQARRASSAAPEEGEEPTTEQVSETAQVAAAQSEAVQSETVTQTPAVRTVDEQPTQPAEVGTDAPAAATPTAPAGEQPSEPADDQPTQQPSEPASEQPSEPVSEQLTQPMELTEQVTGQAAGEPVSDQPSELPSEQPTQPVSEQPGELLSELPSEEMLTELGLEETISEEALAAYPDDNDTIKDVATLEDTKWTFTVTRGNQKIIPELATSGRAYTFQLELRTTAFNQYVPGIRQEVYSLIVDTKGLTLRMRNANQQMVNAEEAAADYIKIQEDSAAWMKIVRLTDGTYQFLFRSVGSTVNYISIEGEGVSTRTVQDMNIKKRSTFNPTAFTYDYTVDADVPGAVDTYNQYYCFDDYTTVTTGNDQSTEFNGFGRNMSTLQVSVSQDGGSSFTTIKPIDEAVNDPDATLAYYLHCPGGDTDKAVVYLYNKTVHDGEHLVTAPVNYAGWGICWEQVKDTIVRFQYTDNASKELYDANTKILNIARVWDQDYGLSTGHMATAENDVNYSGIIGKEGKAVASGILEYTITLNNSQRESNRINMGDTPLSIQDTVVKNGKILPDSFRVVRMSDNAEISRGVDGYQVDVANDGKSFALTLAHPGSSPYRIIYRVQQDDQNSNENLNQAVIANAGESKMSNLARTVYDDSIAENNTRSFGIRVQFTKRYEQNNPPKGAKFGLFLASNDEPIALSATEGENDQSAVHTKRTFFCYINGNPVERSYTPYQYNGSEDTIIFTTNSGMKYGKVYYIKEIEAPEGYDLLEDRIYFYATSLDPAHVNDVPEKATALINAGKTVYRLDDWKVVVNDSNVTENRIDHDFTDDVGTKYNYYCPVTLPETGGTGLAIPMSLFGFGVAFAVLVLIYRKRVTGRG